MKKCLWLFYCFFINYKNWFINKPMDIWLWPQSDVANVTLTFILVLNFTIGIKFSKEIWFSFEIFSEMKKGLTAVAQFEDYSVQLLGLPGHAWKFLPLNVNLLVKLPLLHCSLVTKLLLILDQNGFLQLFKTDPPSDFLETSSTEINLLIPT